MIDPITLIIAALAFIFGLITANLFGRSVAADTSDALAEAGQLAAENERLRAEIAELRRR
jgi:hypothetical protein